jgi:hypothetical protein
VEVDGLIVGKEIDIYIGLADVEDGEERKKVVKANVEEYLLSSTSVLFSVLIWCGG